MRAISGQKSLVARTSHGIAYDPIRDVFMVPQFYGQAILVFRGGADGEEAPIRIIQGLKTQLRNPDKLMLDAVSNEIYVPQGDRVLVFSGDGQGDLAPKRVLGPDKTLGAQLVAIDPVRNLLVVAGGGGRGRQGRFQIFDRTASGDAKAKWVIQGPHAEINFLFGPIEISPRGWIVAGIRTQAELGGDDNFVGVWDMYAKGDVPPIYRIGGPNVLLQQVRGVTLDTKHKELIVTDKRINGILTYSFPEIF